MRRFKEFYYRILSESPMFIGDSREDYSLDTIIAQEKYNEILEYPEKFKKVSESNTEIPVDLYEEQDGTEIICWFVPKNNKFIVGYVSYNILNDGGIETTSVFNDKSFQFLAYKVYLYYLLRKYPYIMSDKRHTRSGKRFWENIVNFSLKSYKVSMINAETMEEVELIKSIRDLEKYYGDASAEKYRIKIESI